MSYRLRFRTPDDAARAERALDEVGGYTALPGGLIAVPDNRFAQATEALQRHGVDFRAEEVEPYLGGRSQDEERE